MLRKYYVGGSGGRFYHHTAPVNMTYALREALADRRSRRASTTASRAISRCTSGCARAWKPWA